MRKSENEPRGPLVTCYDPLLQWEYNNNNDDDDDDDYDDGNITTSQFMS